MPSFDEDGADKKVVSVRDRSLLGMIGGFLLLVAAVAGIIWLTIRQQQAFERVSHTLVAENRISQILLRMEDAETGQRGFLLTGRSEFLEPYDDAVSHLAGDLAALRETVADNPRQLRALSRLEPLTRARQDLLRLSISGYRRGEAIRADRLLQGKAEMDEIRVVLAGMRGEESRLLSDRTIAADRHAILLIATLLVSALLVVGLGLFVLASSHRRLKQAVETGRQLAEANVKLTEEAASRAEAESQVRQMQKIEAVGQLTGGIAHDFNNMLALVVGSLDLALRRLGRGDLKKVTACIGNALEGAQRASQLTSRLLAFSRQQPLSPQALDVNKLVGGMSELLRRTIGEQLRVETVLAGGLWRTFADPNQLENAVVNLCVNARDAMPDGGRLTIETANGHLDEQYAASHVEVEAGQYVAISVSDTGTGMTEEVARRAFDPFYTTKGVGKGTGLGLSQVFGFVKQSRGHVAIYSEPGHGTTVKIYLPRFLGLAEEANARNAATEIPGDLPRARDEIILVVEDDERVRHVSVDALRELGYTVVQAADSNQALAVLTIQPVIDLLFTDVVMPDMNGRQLADAAREQRPGLKVLFTTGYTRNAIVHNGMLDAGVAFIAKPFTIEQLAQKVRQVLDSDPA
ncbi:MAG: signal transduction histidine kinase [Alphaproteobacteria bacterium]|nr:signal transduction histidine kinase [Alphaproteobacteria bacterium]